MDTQHLKKRGQGWYVNLRVPAEVAQAIGKTHITRSLGTRDEKEANKRKHKLIAEIYAYFESVRQATASDTPLSELTAAAKVLSKEIKLNNADPIQIGDKWSTMLDKYLDQHHKNPLSLSPEAEQYNTTPEIEQQIRQASAVISNPDLYLLSDALGEYLSEVAKRIRKQTLNAKERHINEFLSWLSVDKEPHEVNRKEAGRFVTEVLLKQEIATKSKKEVLLNISAFFKWMLQRGRIEANPFTGMSGTLKDSTRGTQDNVKRHEWAESELVLLLEHLKGKKDTRYHDMAMLALYTGMRSNEIAETEIIDVYDDHIFIPESKTESSVSGNCQCSCRLGG